MKESELEKTEEGHWVTIHHLTMLGHKVADLDGIMNIQLEDGFESRQPFEIWCCMHPTCNYLEFRLKEGHREEDR